MIYTMHAEDCICDACTSPLWETWRQTGEDGQPVSGGMRRKHPHVPTPAAASVAPDPWGQGPDDKPNAYTFRPAEPDDRDDPNSYPMAVSRGDGLRPLFAAALAYRRAWDSPHPFAADAVDALNVAMSALCAAALAATKVKP